MATAPTRPAVPDTPSVSQDRGLDRHTVRSDWTASDYESFEYLTLYAGDAFAAAHVNRARVTVPETAASWLRRFTPQQVRDRG